MAVDYARAMAGYKVAGEGGDAVSQYQVGIMYYFGRGVDVDYKQARAWYEKAAAQDFTKAHGYLSRMYFHGQGVTPSLRCVREYCERASELGDSEAMEEMQTLSVEWIPQVTSRRSIHTAPLSLTEAIQNVTSRRSNTPPLLSSLIFDLTFTPLPSPFFSATRRSPPSWTSGWRSTARIGRT